MDHQNPFKKQQPDIHYYQPQQQAEDCSISGMV